MKKNIVFKIILVLSFAPYAFALIYGIYSAFAGFNIIYGFNVFFSVAILVLWILCSIPVVPVCLIYQTAYLLNFLIEKYNIEAETLNIIKKIILLISFLPCAVVLIYGIYSAFIGFSDIRHTFYGINAFWYAVVEEIEYLCLYPVIPPCLAYQIIYLISFIIKKHTIKSSVSKLLELFYL